MFNINCLVVNSNILKEKEIRSIMGSTGFDRARILKEHKDFMVLDILKLRNEFLF